MARALLLSGPPSTPKLDWCSKVIGAAAAVLAIAFITPAQGADISTAAPAPTEAETGGGWQKYENNPVMGGKHGTCFDISVLRESDTYRMWLSWRPQKSVALVASRDGFHWSEPPVVVLGPKKETGWEEDINRPVVIKRPEGYHMWYTGQARNRSWIGYATSTNGVDWKRMSDQPVISAEQPWEKGAVMCPHVLWDEETKQFRMWYSAGGQYEPDAIGHATSPDGLHWNKHKDNPVFRPEQNLGWEKELVTGCQVIREGAWYVMFYIGFRDINHAQIGLARSPDGITHWQRHPANPIVRAGVNKWDHDACYKPYAIFDGKKWLLWYNGRHGSLEQIGVVFHEGRDLGFPDPGEKSAGSVLEPGAFEHYVDWFNRNDHEIYPQYIRNTGAWDFLKDNIPFLECPDKDLEEIYYFRWWTYRKHIKQTPDGFIITEFLPSVAWAGKHNSICCAAGHHLHEGRWLHDSKYLDDYSRFWFGKGGNPRTYSFWAADSVWARYLVTGDDRVAKGLLPELIKNYEAWEGDHQDANGLFWQADGNDGMEVSISGALHPNAQGYRVTINSYMYGDALAIANIADLTGKHETAKQFRAKASRIRDLVHQRLWDPDAQFFKVLPRGENTQLSNVRELHGYTPWYFGLPDLEQAVAWKQIGDPRGFFAPFGPTTAEQRHPKFALSYQGHECQWNGPSWPFSTSTTLTALANLLNDPRQKVMAREDYMTLLGAYTKSHRLQLEDGRVVPWIDENLNPANGDWLARTRLKAWKNGKWDQEKGGEERGKDYNHSTFCDLVISGLIGLRPRSDEIVEVNPLVPGGAWDYFCLDCVSYHGHNLAILYDRVGERYHRGKGLRILADGKQIAARDELGRLTAPLP